MADDRMARLRERLGGVAFGGDYNPEQWDPAVWREDVELMRRAGVNLVTVGVFAWASLEAEPGVFTFDWLDEVLDLLHSGGIAVDLATPTMAPPVWLSHGHPEVLPVREDGQRFGFGNRLHYDPASPRYREAAARITDAIAARYAQHPSVAMWHLSNEYGPVSWGGASAAAFRDWLRERYGDLEALNDAWYTRFWGQRYTAWEQVEPPEVPRSWSNPTRRLDFLRFASDVLLECFTTERDIVRRYSELPITTNFMRFYRRADYWRWAQEEDVVALDIYPNPGEADSRVAAALNFDLMRSLKGGPWVLMEQAASAVSQWPVNNVKRPGMMRAGSYQAIAHGADTVLFFQWRASRGGHERFHSAMLPHSGTRSRTWREIEALGGELGRIAEVTGATSRADVALVFDWNAWWGLMETHGLPRNDFDYAELETSWYRPLLEAHLAVDLASFESALDGYRCVLVPNAYLVTDAFAQRLARFAEAGGTVVIGFFSGVVDERNQVLQPAYPGAFRQLIGAYIDEYWPARAGESFGVRFASGEEAVADWWQESIELETGAALAEFRNGLLAGRPAVVENRVGEGRVVYVGTRLEASALATLLLDTAHAAGVASVVADAPAQVEATMRSKGGADYLFLINHSETDAAAVRLPRAGVDLLTGAAVSGTLELEPLGVAVVRCG
ncbi:beta-galactosidase [Gryllotalpicola ginsengisoli]|uniref:beta-galactosidase n=1 Tax=Gryllotalpicola ginsengisoli TaxID=444608 RepID=UPI0003B65F66|nr:beta-galactosidase [Gryllotalpicola ginsengisoli]